MPHQVQVFLLQIGPVLITLKASSLKDTKVAKVHKDNRGFSVVEVLLVLITLGIIGTAGYFVAKHVDAKNTADITTAATKTINKTTKTISPAPTDTWTGSGSNSNWSDASNWTIGIPKSGDNLVFNTGVIMPISGGASPVINNDLANLTVGSIILEGSPPNGGVDFAGDSFSLSGNITDTTQAPPSNPNYITTTVFTFSNDITLVSNSVVSEQGKNSLQFIKGTFNLNGHHLTLQNVPADLFKGSGILELSGNEDLFQTGEANTDFSGSVEIDKDGVVNTSIGEFGSGSIEIANGGSWEIDGASGSTTAIVSNPITVSGRGATNSDGSINGAISACLTSAEEGCGASEQLTFTGSVKLLGNTQIGTSAPSSDGANNTHVNYVFNNLNKNGHTITIVTDRPYYPEF